MHCLRPAPSSRGARGAGSAEARTSGSSRATSCRRLPSRIWRRPRVPICSARSTGSRSRCSASPTSTAPVQVDAAGRISLPLAGTIEVAGLTPAQVEDLIEERLRGRYVRDPQVTVNLTEARQPGRDGRRRGGRAGHLSDRRADDADARHRPAKGMTEFARQQHVVVFRTVGEQHMAALYDLRAIRAAPMPIRKSLPTTSSSSAMIARGASSAISCRRRPDHGAAHRPAAERQLMSRSMEPR